MRSILEILTEQSELTGTTAIAGIMVRDDEWQDNILPNLSTMEKSLVKVMRVPNSPYIFISAT